MPFQVANMSFALPEIWLLSMACVVLLVVAYGGNKRINLVSGLSQLTLLSTAVLVYLDLGQTGLSFSGNYIKDPLSDLLKLAITLINMPVLAYCRGYLQDRNLRSGEFYVLALFSTLGMLVMVSGHTMLTLYLGLELMSLCLYAMVAMHRESSIATEAAMKYFILGALASGMLLYGMSMIYGVTGSLVLSEIAIAVSASSAELTVLSFALVFIIIGIGFKFGAVPFHMWLPDVYHGAPTAMTLFLATAPKLAAFALLIRLLVDGLGSLHAQWQDMIILLAVLSMLVGNLLAIAQTNLKRMLAYSTISHVGFLFLGIVSGTAEGYAAGLFYALIYALMTAGGFGMILLMSRQGFEAEQISDYSGLASQRPWLALMMLLLMFSMAGIPPLAGFYAKLTVIKSVIDVNLLTVAIFAVLMSVVGAFYYLRMIKVMYFDKPLNELTVVRPTGTSVLLSANGLFVLGLGLFPGWLISLCNSIFV
ncbi:NADH-ubiquinone oxidoreductase chain N [Methylophaga frappieri]|uniref:NADH-quinone oxidoreductase subunit N n=1 Tax=Methylophaga frappieri (strain ATCC BAA-2434 / DSM 25690 / JAM7) TaxID=754477 RepID=I1YHF7_METFJ|nr:NADH-quinone oxidoreductase subunit NuoN [Methylophaga frappieri]AFJ02350.1 NADH-ubiquinone oxidoreductase chain N [Methylophaga frappieri]